MTVDELEAYGTERMDDDGIEQLLSNRTTGVLALPAEGAPSMRPLSFRFDGDSSLHFVYVVGEGSRKAELSDRADAAQFLVYSMETPFNWRSVLLTGSISRVPRAEADAVAEAMETTRPDLFERALAAEDIELYRFDVEERTGIKHLGLPPELSDDGDDAAE
jgi:nitroimidazol reductase NimA-like FMN-containing flavoprotein (pyridoxamine 5'-phosphate oxidase superfamily)